MRDARARGHCFVLTAPDQRVPGRQLHLLAYHAARLVHVAADVAARDREDSLRESKLLRNVLQPAAERAGLGRVTWHHFRHIHSSLLNDLKVPVKIAQEQLGHASISTTLNIYTHVVDASHRKAVEAVEERLFGEMDCFWTEVVNGRRSAATCKSHRSLGLGLEAPPGFEPRDGGFANSAGKHKLLPRLAFWCLSDPRFTRYLGSFGPTLDPSSSFRFSEVLRLDGDTRNQWLRRTSRLDAWWTIFFRHSERRPRGSKPV
jgi:hypothetical protein